MNEVLVFDWGTTIVGILDINSDLYVPYRHSEKMREAANRIISSAGTIVSFNGNARDLVELSKMLGLESASHLSIRGTHDDMLEVTSNIRWPPNLGTGSILGPGLTATYRHYFGDGSPSQPSFLQDDYEVSNWHDCHMTAELWKKWKRGELEP